MDKKQDPKKDKITHKNYSISKYDLLFISLYIIAFIAGLVLSVKSKKYNLSLREQNPNYYYPTLLEIIINTAILTVILLIAKISVEKILFQFTEIILVDKYKKNEFKHEKEKAKRKMTIYGVKFFHYLIITIVSYFVFNKLEFFPKELFGNGDMNKLYYKGIESFSFFERPKYFEFHYLFNLAYTFADLICVVFINDRQTDILVVLFHHFCTISLILFSYYNHCDGIGAIIVFIHNASDIISYLARTFLYVVAPSIIKKVLTVILLINWLYSRQFLLGKVIYGIFVNITWESFGIIESFKFLLIGLYILHCYWLYKLIQIVYNGVKGKFIDSTEFTKDKKNKKII